MTAPDFEDMALEWLVRATGHVPVGREASLAVVLRAVYEAGLEAAALACDAYRGHQVQEYAAGELAEAIRALKGKA